MPGGIAMGKGVVCLVHGDDRCAECQRGMCVHINKEEESDEG